MGYRVAEPGTSFAYLPDHAPSHGVTEAGRKLIDGVDVLLHDAQFVESERALAEDYGHATVADAIALADDADVGRLVLFHHSPARTDDQLDHIVDSLESRAPLLVAREGMRIPVGTTATSLRSGP